MSKRIVDDPSLHGWVEEDGKWVWDGQSAGAGIEDGDTEGQITTWSGSEWTPESAVVVSGGNVGIGTDSPSKNLVISNNGVNGIEFEPDDSGRQSNAMLSYDRQAGEYTPIFFDCQSYKFRTHSPDQAAIPALTIDSAGSVGIGMVPLRSTSKEQLAEWKTRFDARLKAEPKADKKAVTLEITDDAFEVLPTEEALAEWMETRAAGDKLQVNGNITAITGPGSFGTVSGNRFVSANQAGFVGRTGANNGLPYILPVDGDGNISDDAVSLGRTTTEGSGNNHRFRDAHFSGTVNAGGISATGTVNAVGGVNVGADPGVTGIRLYASGAIYARMASTSTNQLFRGYGGTDLTSWINSKGDANFSGTVEANQFTRNGVPVPTTVDLIKTLTTLRNATKDETTLEGLRDAIGNAIGGLIEEFEAMQDQVSTQDIQE